MIPIEFPEQTDILAKNQPQYLPMPVHRCTDSTGKMTFCWKLTWQERFKLLLTGKIWQQVMTFHGALQPQRLSIDKPNMGNPHE